MNNIIKNTFDNSRCMHNCIWHRSIVCATHYQQICSTVLCCAIGQLLTGATTDRLHNKHWWHSVTSMWP